jgi:hypothetical protein
MVQPELVSLITTTCCAPSLVHAAIFCHQKHGYGPHLPYAPDLDPSNFFFSKNKITFMKVLFSGNP